MCQDMRHHLNVKQTVFFEIFMNVTEYVANVRKKDFLYPLYTIFRLNTAPQFLRFLPCAPLCHTFVGCRQAKKAL